MTLLTILFKRTVFYFIFSIIGLTMAAQPTSKADKPDRECSLEIIGGKTTPLMFDRNYPGFLFSRSEIQSDPSLIFALRFNYSRTFKLVSRFMWDIGFELGTDSYHLRLFATPQFVDLGRNKTYYKNTTRYQLPYFATTLNIRYNLPISKRSKLSFKIGSRFTYFRSAYIGTNFSEASSSGKYPVLFFMLMESNPDKTVIISPDLTTEYYYLFPQSGFSVSLGFNTSFSRKPFITGTYQIFGDQETLEGSVSKKAMFLALNLGISYHLQ